MIQRKNIILGVVVYFCFSIICLFGRISFSGERNIFTTISHKEEDVQKKERVDLRAFYSAPPIIPHEVETQNPQDCLRCHANVTKLEDGRVAMQTPHPQFSNCMQCHVPGQSNNNQVKSHWQGLEEPTTGDRWFPVSPPTIPHRIFLRENCLSCHGPENPDTKMRTTHPERTSCMQCHVPNVSKEF